jgi:hypothetical protein
MSVMNWLPVFVSNAACQIITDSLDFCHERKGLRVNAYEARSSVAPTAVTRPALNRTEQNRTGMIRADPAKDVMPLRTVFSSPRRFRSPPRARIF